MQPENFVKFLRKNPGKFSKINSLLKTDSPTPATPGDIPNNKDPTYIDRVFMVGLD